jgi:hypothetical protein
MRIYERLRERQSPRFIERDAEMDIAPAGANTVHDKVDFQPADAIYRGHAAETPQANSGHA